MNDLPPDLVAEMWQVEQRELARHDRLRARQRARKRRDWIIAALAATTASAATAVLIAWMDIIK